MLLCVWWALVALWPAAATAQGLVQGLAQAQAGGGANARPAAAAPAPTPARDPARDPTPEELAAAQRELRENRWRGFSTALTPAQRDYWETLRARAVELRLWERRRWQLLLHYLEDTFGGGVTSEADGPGFFLAETGKTDARAELEQTLAAFFATRAIPPGLMTPQCTFPARYRWLNAQLGFDPARLPPQPCPRFERWRGRIDADSVSLIFSSYFFNNPASMFGHTLLRFNRRGSAGATPLLDSALNYAAYVPPGEGNFTYAVRGIFGGYRGYFSLLPYYLKVREYNDLENRDLWEYRLTLDADELDYMLRHTWEMGSTYFDYFFFKENCSYHLLSMLEVARPTLRLRDAYGLWTMPTETVQQVLALPDLVEEVIYRPSPGSQMAQKLAVMADGEAEQVGALIADPASAVEAPAFVQLARPRRALVLDAAIDYYQYQLADRPAGMKQEKANLRKLLLQRSRIPVSDAPPLHLPPQSAPPHLGHDSRRIEIAAGAARPPLAPDAPAGTEKENQPFGEISIQAAFHDLLSDDRAFAPNSHISLLHLRGRFEDRDDGRADSWQLERFALLDVVSLFPVTQLSSQPSWHLDLSWNRVRDGACADCTPFTLSPGIGYSVRTTLFTQEVYYLMLEGALQTDSELEHQHRSGFGLGAGIVLTFTDWWRAALLGRRINYTEGQRSDVGEASLQTRFTLTRNVELSLEWKGVEDYREGKLALGYYF